jgi:hypothetical protein
MSANRDPAMTTIGPQAYASNSAQAYNRTATTPAPQTDSQKTAADPGGSSGTSAAVNITLSDAAKAAMQAQSSTPSIDDVVSAARSALDDLLAAAKAKDALSNGKPTIDMSDMDRRTLFAISSNQGGVFTADEQSVAAATMSKNFQDALAGAVAGSRVTGDYASIYKAGLDYLDAAGPEEKATAQWSQLKDALTAGYQQATNKPGVLPSGIPNDPIAGYVKALGGAAPVTGTEDILDVASDARAALDAQAAGATDPDAKPDVSSFDDRGLAAVALNEGNGFSEDEVAAARNEIRSRTASSTMSVYTSSSGSGGPDPLGTSLIARYDAMSPEERQAQGWTPELYAKLVQNNQVAQKLAAMQSGGTSPYASSGASGGSGAMSLLDYIA